MNPACRFLFVLVFVTACGFAAQAKDWRGLIPLHSTRTDVLSEMGEERPRFDDYFRYEPSPETAYYDLGDSTVIFRFAPALADRKAPLPASIPEGMLLSIEFQPDCPASWADLKLERNRFRRLATNNLVGGSVIFADRSDGVWVSVFQGRLEVALYLPAATEREQASEYYALPDTTTMISGRGFSREGETNCVRIASGWLMTSWSTKGMLDQLAFELTNQPSTRGYLLTFGRCGRRHRDSRALARRSLEYLVKQRGIDRARITLVNGGYRYDNYVVPAIPSDPAFGPYRRRREMVPQRTPVPQSSTSAKLITTIRQSPSTRR